MHEKHDVAHMDPEQAKRFDQTARLREDGEPWPEVDVNSYEFRVTYGACGPQRRLFGVKVTRLSTNGRA